MFRLGVNWTWNALALCKTPFMCDIRYESHILDQLKSVAKRKQITVTWSHEGMFIFHVNNVRIPLIWRDEYSDIKPKSTLCTFYRFVFSSMSWFAGCVWMFGVSMVVLILIQEVLFTVLALTHAPENNSFVLLWGWTFDMNLTWQKQQCRVFFLTVTGLLVDFTLICMLNRIVYIMKRHFTPKHNINVEKQQTICGVKMNF